MERNVKRGLRRLAVIVAVATVGVLAVGAQAASAQVIEICKSSANGMSGRAFQYSITGGAQVSVNGGRCSGPITVAASQVTITEAQSSPATDVYAVTVRPSLRKVSQDLPNRSVTVTTGATTSSETLVTFTNQPAGGNYGTLKVCKLTETPAYLGRLFSFSANGGPLVSTEANDAFDDPANWSCRILGTFQVGSNVTVHEAVPAGTEVQFIDSDPATALADFNTSTGDSLITIGAGVTVVLYDDEPLPPSGTGWLEVCKDAAWLDKWHQDPDVHGSFHFTVTDAAGATYSKDVLAGQCSEPFQVAAGISEVTEGPSPGYDLVDVQTIPEDRLLTTNLINRTADVEVPASDSSNDETQVHFFNETQRGQLKLCKTLGPGSSDLIGTPFDLHWSSDSGASGEVWVTAQASTQCVIVGNLPIGATVALSEQNPGDYIDVSGPSSITLAPGINTATYTNTARGLLEICKAKVVFEDPPFPGGSTGVFPPPPQPTFTFRIDGAGMLNVRGGTCSLPQRVSVGTHTVTELTTPADYELNPYAPGHGITVSPADREVSRNLNLRTVTVNVPYGPNGETLVTYYNRVKLGQVKICKQIPITSQDALGGKDFTFDVFVAATPVGLVADFQVGPIKPGECTFPTLPIPILDAAGGPVLVEITENPLTTPFTTTVTCTGCRQFFVDQQTGTAVFFVGPGINAVTFTNTALDP